jgi:hypothetical protein
VLFIEGSRYVVLVLLEEGLMDLFFPLVVSSFLSPVLLTVADLLFRPPLVMANNDYGSLARFDL